MRSTSSRKAAGHSACTRSSARMTGAAIIETVIALPVLLVVILGAIQFALVYEAKATLNHAGLQAARAGSFANANVAAIRRGLARGLAPLHSPDSSVESMVQTIGRIEMQLATDARVRILNPTQDAFADFGQNVNGQRELPNDRLHARSTVLGTRSGLNIQDANLLRVEITYGYELQVPLVNWFLSRVLLAANGAGIGQWDAFEQQLLRRSRLPMVATSTVRMQSPARLNDAMVAKSDLPTLDRIDPNTRPASDSESTDDGDDNEGNGTSQPGSEGDGRSLADGAFGFHGDHGDSNPEGGGSPPSQEGDEPDAGGDSNSGSPAMCNGGGDSGGILDDFETPGGGGQSSPVDPQPNPLFSATSSNSAGAFLPSNSLPSLAVGNPIHVATGNKYQAETDLPSLPGTLGLGFSRHYNSDAAQRAGVFGAGWRHGFEARLLVDESRDDRVRLIQADGRILSFVKRAKDATRYVGERASDGDLIVQARDYRWRWSDGRELAFDTLGKLTSITAGGERVQLVYQGERLVRVTDPQLRSLSLLYYPNGRVSQVSGPAGFEARYRYDDVGNLAEVVYSDNTARLYRYEATGLPHHLTGIATRSASLTEFGRSDRQITIAAWAYDKQGRAISSTHPQDAGKVSLDYGDGHTHVTDAFGQTTRYDYEWIDGTARVTAVSGPGCGSCGRGDVRYAYGEHFTLSDVHTAYQPSLHYRYDDQRRLAQIDRTDLAGARDWLFRFRYDGESRIPTITEQPSVNPNGLHVTRTRFDASGNPTSTSELGYSPTASGAFEAIERTTRFTYDKRHRLISVDGPRTDVIDVARFEYDEHGRLTHVRTPSTILRVSKFDAAGRITSFESDRRHADIDYDSRGRIRAVTQKAGSTHRSLQYQYDDVGRLSATIDDTGRTQRFNYDQANRLNDVSVGGSLHERHTYAADDRPVRSSLMTSTGHALRTLYFAYDAQRRLIETRDGSGPALQQVRYLDADQRPDLVLDPLGAETLLGYDALGRLNEVRAPDGGLTQFQFDDLQQLLSVTAPNGAHTSYRYDDFGRRVEENSPDRGRLRYRYDTAGNLVRKTDARDIATDYRYDAAGRITRILQAEDTTEIQYRDGRVISISNSRSSEHRNYDDAGRLIEHSRRIDGHEFTTAYQYDTTGRLISKRMPSGERLVHIYDSKGSLIGLRAERLFRSQLLLGTNDPTSAAAPISANMLGDLRLGNGLVTRTRLDLESGGIAYRGTDGVTAFSYRRDASGRIIGIDTASESSFYGYDSTGRLTSARRPGETLAYEYDPNGNRVASTRTERSKSDRTAFTYERDSNRLTLVASDDPAHAGDIVYDSAGNPLSTGKWSFVYDSNSLPTKLYRSGKRVAVYTFNSYGERIKKEVFANGEKLTTYYVYEQRKLIAEADEQGRITHEYIYVGHHPVVMFDDREPYWIHTDQLGTPTAVTDAARRTVWLARYEPFGSAETNNDPDGDGRKLELNIRLPGQYADAESGTHYNYRRTYNPALGRYLTSDPIGLGGGQNTFAYVSANPLDSIDPLGTYQQDVHYYMTFFLGVVAGMDPEEARYVALATQFVDDNVYTRPPDARNVFSVIHSIFVNQTQLKLYHFVLSDENGSTLSDYDTDEYRNPTSPQLERMLDYAFKDPVTVAACLSPAGKRNVQLQFFGEYLHAFEDTFSHRDRDNFPYDPIFRIGDNEYGLGHGPDLSHPDYTYNHNTLLHGNWTVNEERTLAMEEEVWGTMKAHFGDPEKAASWETIRPILQEFNATSESNLDPDAWIISRKVAILSQALIDLGYGDLRLSNVRGGNTYSSEEAAANRRIFNALDSRHYDHAILETEDGHKK